MERAPASREGEGCHERDGKADASGAHVLRAIVVEDVIHGSGYIGNYDVEGGGCLGFEERCKSRQCST
jgi:hypothetical protein